MIEVWSSRIFKGLGDSCPVSDMKSTDEFAVCQLEVPLAPSSPEKKKGGVVSSGQASSQGGGEVGRDVGGTSEGGGGAAVLIDLVLATESYRLKGRPQRITCR